MSRLLDGNRLVMGVCYYPEHWSRTLWEEDLNRMKAVGIEVIRVAEFAWSKLEPTEGEFTFRFFDDFLDMTDRVGMQVILGTPTATPPAWLTEKYPDVLNGAKDGTLYRHGMRRHYNYNSANYRRLAGRLVERMARHYGKRASVIGWQIDNELNCETDLFFSESDDEAFRTFLQEKYQTLDALNDAWGTVFWNQTYTAWEEVHIPRPTLQGVVNPHRTLDYIRFISASAVSFAAMQAEIIRRYRKQGDFITTNGIFGHLDYQALRDTCLDFITYDSYPNFAYCINSYDRDGKGLRDRKWSLYLSEARSISPVFGIMEQQSGANGWNSGMMAPTPRPGQITLWAMQSIAHGADFVSFFRWRTATMGTEMYWHGILDYSGRDNRRLREIEELHRKLEKLDRLAGSRYEAQVALLKTRDNSWDAEIDVWHGAVNSQSEEALFAAAQRTHTPMDILYLTDRVRAAKLSRYQVLFWPHPTILTPAQAALLTDYVQAGGKLVVGCRSAYKDETGKCVDRPLPGLLSALTGCDIPEYSAIAPDAGEVFVDWDGDRLPAAVFTDLLEAQDGGEVIAVYGNDYYAGSGALTRKRSGQGEAYYYGTAFTERAVRIFLKKLGVMAPYADKLWLPESAELAVREKNGERFAFLLNYRREEISVEIKEEALDLLSGACLKGTVMLPGYGVKLLCLS